MKYSLYTLLLIISLQISFSQAGTCTNCYPGTEGDCLGELNVCFAAYPDGTCPPSSNKCIGSYHWKTFTDPAGECQCKYVATASGDNFVDQSTCCIKQCATGVNYCASNGTETNHWKKTTSGGHCVCEYVTPGDNAYHPDQASCCQADCTSEENYCATNGTKNHWKSYTDSKGDCMCQYDEAGSLDYAVDQSTCCKNECKAHNPAYCASNGTQASCIWDYKKCDTSTVCCNINMECKEDFCAFKPVVAMKKVSSSLCGDSTKMNFNIIADGDSLTAIELAKIWSSATQGLTIGMAPGGMETCVEAVSTAIGECGHAQDNTYTSAHSLVCSRVHSGEGGIWQITSADDNDHTMAGCTDGKDPCCNARIGYAHATIQGGATVIPDDYCEMATNNCRQITETKNNVSLFNAPWNSAEVDKTKPSKKIPKCSGEVNPWYTNSSFHLVSQTQDQAPCYWGPFAVAGAGYYTIGRSFFPGFYGWGGFFQHYTDSKGGKCDPTPQGDNCNPNEGEWAKIPNYYEIAKEACGIVKQEILTGKFKL